MYVFDTYDKMLDHMSSIEIDRFRSKLRLVDLKNAADALGKSSLQVDASGKLSRPSGDTRQCSVSIATLEVLMRRIASHLRIQHLDENYPISIDYRTIKDTLEYLKQTIISVFVGLEEHSGVKNAAEYTVEDIIGFIEVINFWRENYVPIGWRYAAVENETDTVFVAFDPDSEKIMIRGDELNLSHSSHQELFLEILERFTQDDHSVSVITVDQLNSFMMTNRQQINERKRRAGKPVSKTTTTELDIKNMVIAINNKLTTKKIPLRIVRYLGIGWKLVIPPGSPS